jgi:hypothetical protein
MTIFLDEREHVYETFLKETSSDGRDQTTAIDDC